jgi:outer membrane protein OmpA-like peptidoglycan-associated protein/outer membrane protein assembly factor BamB
MGNQYLTGNNDGIIPEGEGVIWRFDSAGSVFNPVGVNDRVYVVSTDNFLYCLDMMNGDLLWSFKSEGPLTRMVVVYEGRVYLPAGRFIYCIDEESGEVIWGRRDPSFGFYGTPTIAAGRIFYGNRKGFYARELLNGHMLWENKNIFTYGGFPSHWYDMVYTVSKEFQNDNARLLALDQYDGSIRWQTVLTNTPTIFSPVVYDEKIYLAFGEQLSVFDAETGESLFEIFFPDKTASHPVFSNGMIFLSLADGSILKIDPDTGEYRILYKTAFGLRFAVVGSYLFIPIKENQGGFMVVDSNTGEHLRSVMTGGGESSTLTVSKGITFVPSLNSLYAVGDGVFFARAPMRVIKPTEKPDEKDRDEMEIAAVTGEDAGAGEGAGTGTGPGLEYTTIKGEVKDSETQKPLSGKVEATTKLESGEVISKEETFSDGTFEIDVPKKGQTDITISSSGYTFESITLPDEEAINDLSTEGLEVSLPKAVKGTGFTVDSIHYKTGSANLEPNSIPTLNKLLEMMNENPDLKIEIEGHTDSTGSDEFNMTLSDLRAEAVASWLIQNGVSSKRISTKGYGETNPVADNSTEEGRRKNRRTEIIIKDD